MRPKKIISFSAPIAFMFIHLANALAQIPTGTPRTDKPLQIQTTADIIIYLVLPLLIIILFILWWKYYKKPKEEEKKKREEEQQNK